MSADLLELAERCEKATGPDRELDGAIRKAVHGDFGFCGDDEGAWWCSACSLPVTDLTQEPGCGAPLGLKDERRSYPSDWRDDERLPRYTASLDAAMTLVPEGEGRWPQQDYIGPNPNNGPDGHRVKLWLSGGKKVRGEHPTSYALALCAAALRAHHTTESSNG